MTTRTEISELVRLAVESGQHEAVVDLLDKSYAMGVLHGFRHARNHPGATEAELLAAQAFAQTELDGEGEQASAT